MGLVIEIVFLIVIILIIIAYLVSHIIYKDLVHYENEAKLSGCEIARKISSKFCKEEPHIIKKKGKFLDYYDQERNVIKLSPEVFDGTDMYASTISLRLALETKENKSLFKNEKICSFIVFASYIVIIMGGFLNKSNIIHFGFILFIAAFLLEVFYVNFYFTEDEVAEVIKMVKKAKVIAPIDELDNNLIILSLINIARLPISFINYFR